MKEQNLYFSDLAHLENWPYDYSVLGTHDNVRIHAAPRLKGVPNTLTHVISCALGGGGVEFSRNKSFCGKMGEVNKWKYSHAAYPVLR